MGLTNADLILIDTNNNLYGVSGSMPLPTGAIGQLVAGVNSATGLVSYLSTSAGALVVTGTVNSSIVFPPGTAVDIANWPATLGVSGSVGVYTSGAQAVTGAVSLTNWPAVVGVSGSVGVFTSSPQAVSGTYQSGSVAAAPTFPVLVGGVDASNVVRPLRLDPQGRIDNQCTGSNVTSVNGSSANQTLLFPNPNRVGAIVFNEGPSTCFVKFGLVATVTSYTVQLGTKAYYEVPFTYTGQIDAVFSANSGAARITELT